MKRPTVTLDGNEAVARVAYLTNEVIAIYPITPSSPMGEWADQWASEGLKNIWGAVPDVVEMQSEGGVAGAVHGALQAGSLSTTFTASQGLLLLLPNMYKIAGELTPLAIHVAARTVATHALSIFGDHSDVMAARQTGFALLASNSVQEAMDFALISQAATLESRIPFLHFFDGFRTSHEGAKVELITREDVRALIDDDLVLAHRARGLSPDSPVLRGTAQNPDVFFQSREACNPYYLACPQIVQNCMEKLAERVGRQYHLFDYEGAPDAEHVIVVMGSGAEVVHETVEYLVARGEKVGVLKVRLYRPFSVEHFLNALPPSVRSITVLDRTKEPGAPGEPLYLDVITALHEGHAAGRTPFEQMPAVICGRYGLSSKDFTPAMAKGVFDNMAAETPRNHFTIGIVDDVTHTSIPWDDAFCTEDPETIRAVFYGLGSDGTVGANKNSIKIIGDETDLHAQGYFVYDSKKTGSVTVSHLRFGPKRIRSSYLVAEANFVACHQFGFLERLDVLREASEGATFLLNSPHGPDTVWEKMPTEIQRTIVERKLRFFVINAAEVAAQAELGGRINTVMQACFFGISGILPREQAIEAIKLSIRKTYGKRGDVIVQRNVAAVDASLDHLHEVTPPAEVTSSFNRLAPIIGDAPEFVREVEGAIIAGNGDRLPVSMFPVDGTYPTGTTKYEKRCIAAEVPVWDPDVCIQCGKCVMVCPHAVIRGKLYDPAQLKGAPETFQHAPSKWPEQKEKVYTLQVAVEDCTGCELCVEVCPAKNKSAAGLKAINMQPMAPLRESESRNWDFFLDIPDADRGTLNQTRVKDIQLMEPLFEFSGACGGCGETPYLKLMTQLFGDRVVVANATGCSSIYGGNLPTTPWTVNSAGRGPAWSNSLFEDNAEFGYGMRVSIDSQVAHATELLRQLAPRIGMDILPGLLESPQETDEDIEAQRERIAVLKTRLAKIKTPQANDLLSLADVLVRRSVWIIGGDGWAYDIGYGGLDHVISQGRDVNILVLDTEVYSNTGGQQSKSTPRGAVAKFAAAGKPSAKKDLALLAMTYGNVYVARVAMGANDAHTLRVFREAEAYRGPSLIIAYSHCIAHGFNLSFGMDQQKAAVQSGHWPLMRFNPDLVAEGKNPFQLDSKAPNVPMGKYMYNEMRYRMLANARPDHAKDLLALAEADSAQRWNLYHYLSQMPGSGAEEEVAAKES